MPSHNNGQASNLSLRLEPAINSRIPASDTPTPLGTLSILPRELRDEIYRHLNGPKWSFRNNSTYHTRRKDCRRHCHSKWCLTDFNGNKDMPMKALSRSIRQEFLAILQAEDIFSIYDDRYRDEEMWLFGKVSCTRDDIPFIDQIQNVEIHARLYAESDKYCAEYRIDSHEENGYLSTRGADPISFFAGKGVLRNTCVLTLSCSTPKAILILQSPFFDAVRQLTDFRTLTLKVISSSFCMWSREDALAYLGLDVSDSDRTVGVRMIANSMKRALEPSLGPSAISEGFERSAFDIWKITFHPRDFVSKEEKRNAKSGIQGDDGNEVSSQAGGA